jgi:hypothetical protein
MAQYRCGGYSCRSRIKGALDAVAGPRISQNVRSGFSALRFSAVGSQHLMVL